MKRYVSPEIECETVLPDVLLASDLEIDISGQYKIRTCTIVIRISVHELRQICQLCAVCDLIWVFFCASAACE